MRAVQKYIKSEIRPRGAAAKPRFPFTFLSAITALRIAMKNANWKRSASQLSWNLFMRGPV